MRHTIFNIIITNGFFKYQMTTRVTQYLI